MSLENIAVLRPPAPDSFHHAEPKRHGAQGITHDALKPETDNRCQEHVLLWPHQVSHDPRARLVALDFHATVTQSQIW